MKKRISDMVELLLFFIPLIAIESGLTYYGIIWQFQHFAGFSQIIAILVVSVLCIAVGFILLFLFDCLIDTLCSDGYGNNE